MLAVNKNLGDGTATNKFQKLVLYLISVLCTQKDKLFIVKTNPPRDKENGDKRKWYIPLRSSSTTKGCSLSSLKMRFERKQYLKSKSQTKQKSQLLILIKDRTIKFRF